jgi:hypothetical protein
MPSLQAEVVEYYDMVGFIDTLSPLIAIPLSDTPSGSNRSFLIPSLRAEVVDYSIW